MSRSCTVPPSGHLRYFDNESAVQSHPPLDIRALIRGRRETFDFASESCRLLYETCTMQPGGGAFGSPRCRLLRDDCMSILARRDNCVVARDACVSLDGFGSLRIDSATNADTSHRTVWKSRNAGRCSPQGSGGACPDSWRLPLPGITKVEGRCDAPGTRRLRSATLTSPVSVTTSGCTW